jgi:23S rRNA (adenine2503-C2)-methyltransferase
MDNLYGMTQRNLTDAMLSYHEKPYRAKQLFSWLYEKEVTTFDQMTDISLDFRDFLKDKFSLALPEIHTRRDSIDGTVKLLLKLHDTHLIEAVLMRYNYGNVICVTSQVGCNLGCSFCASGLLKKQRNVTAAEMISQVVVMNQILKSEGQGHRVSHIVVMGTGEPFDNYDHVMNFIRIANDPKALNIGARHITVSTSGLPDKIKLYGQEPLQINLAISLHAPNDEIRTRLLRINKAYPIKVLFEAIRDYQKNSGRRITFEYILIEGINDQMEQAEQLAELVQGVFCYVNLIPYNAVMENEYRRPSETAVHAFMDRLMKLGINVTVRKELGHDIEAACGQLRAKVIHEKAR